MQIVSVLSKPCIYLPLKTRSTTTGLLMLLACMARVDDEPISIEVVI